MFKKCFLVAVVMFGFNLGTLVANAAPSAVTAEQTIEITGVVKDYNGEPVPGAGVLIKGTPRGVVTDMDGRFSISAKDGQTLVFSALGYESAEVAVPLDGRVIVTLKESFNTLNDVVVTGVARGISKSTIPFTVEKISDAALQEVTGGDVATTLAGKMPGIKIITTDGNPMSEPIIKLRGGTSFDNNSQPLIIVDGIITDGSIKDINMEDVEDIEVIKGAAAAAFYGSKAAGGVVNIITKRGANMESGSVRVTFKTEEGPNWIGFVPARSTAHGHVLDADGNPTSALDPDNIWDNKWKSTDSWKDVFVPRCYASNTLGITGRSKNGDVNYYASIQNTNNPGVMKLLNGQNRTSFRANMDAQLSPKVKFSTSNLYVRTITDERYINFDDVYYSDPGANFMAKNIDGTDYKVNPNVVSTRNNINPLYEVANQRAEATGNRFLGNYNIRYIPTDWLSLQAAYSIDYAQGFSKSITPNGRLTVESPDGTNRYTGDISQSSWDSFKHNIDASALLTKSFGDFNTNLRFQYIYEDEKYESMGAYGENLSVSGMDIISLELADPSTLNVWDGGYRIVSHSISAIFQGDWKEAVMFDALYRRDGNSLIGSDNMWANYFRVSAAWNIAKTFNMNNVQLLKPRISYGTAGLLPGWGQKYEVYSIGDGALYGASQLGNKNLTPSTSEELETGFDARFWDRLSVEFTYSHKKNVDMPFKNQVSGVTGFEYQWVNLGEFFTNSYEAAITVDIMKQKDFFWQATLTWDKLTQRIGELGRPDFIADSGSLKIASNSKFGDMYNTRFARSLDEVKTHKDIKPGQSVEDVFCINNYGYVVKKEFVGTTKEAHIYVQDENGSNAKVFIGNMLPDFNANLTNTFQWKNLMCYFTISAQKGGLLYNNTRLYMANAGRNAAYWDMSDRQWADKKPYGYSNQFARASFIEDCSFIKMREFAVNYRFSNEQLKKIGLGFIEGLKLGVIGRNLFTLTNFSGPDPETNTLDSNGVFEGTDTPKYPSDIRTVTGTLTIEF